jgi:chemotaxis signal transduction protein
VINLHGQVIPVIDLRLRCGLGFVWLIFDSQVFKFQ